MNFSKVIFDDDNKSLRYQSNQMFPSFNMRKVQMFRMIFFKQACKFVLQISNSIVLHNSNRRLSLKNLNDLCDKNYSEKTQLVAYNEKLFKNAMEQICKAQKQVLKEKKYNLELEHVQIYKPKYSRLYKREDNELRGTYLSYPVRIVKQQKDQANYMH